MTTKLTKRVQGPQFKINARPDHRHFLNVRHLDGFSAKCYNVKHSKELFDIKRGEICVADKKSQAYRDGFPRVFSSLNGYPKQQSDTDVEAYEKRIMESVDFIGIADTECKSTDNAAYQQGFTVSVAGVFTIVNESGQTIRPGDLLEFGLPVGPPAQQGIPPQKMRFTVKKARTHDELLDVAAKAVDAAEKNNNTLKTPLNGISLKKVLADAAIKAYRDAHSRVIGTAMSFSMKGDRLDIKLHSRRSI